MDANAYLKISENTEMTLQFCRNVLFEIDSCMAKSRTFPFSFNFSITNILKLTFLNISYRLKIPYLDNK